MSGDSKGKKEDEPPKFSDPSEDFPPLWVAAMVCHLVEAVEKVSLQVFKGSSPGTSGESHSRTHTTAGKSHHAELS